jgi:zinc transport system substrate-binding protein
MRRIALLGLLALLLTAEASAGEKIRVFVSILPQAQLVEKIGGERVDVTVLVRPGQSPATYSPTPRQLAELSKAKLFVRVGVPFEEGFINKVRETYPKLKIIDQRDNVRLLRSECDHDHDHGETDPHIWLDPKRLKVQAQNIGKAFVEGDPENIAEYNTNMLKLIAELEVLDRKISVVMAPYRGQTLLVYHPAYGYFADAYGLKQVAVESGGKEPGGRQLAKVIEQARKIKAKVIFVQPQFSKKSAELVAEAIGGKVVAMDPLARDVLSNLEKMAMTVAGALE